ncbi:tetratricopeptide repeat protein [Trichothermofontia sp.]
MPDAATGLDTLFEQATAALRAGQEETAIRHYEAILAQVPDDVATLNNLAIALRWVGRFDAAIEHYQTLIRLQPNSAIAHFNLGNAYHDRGDLAAAIAAFRQSLALEPSAGTYINLGLSLYDAGDPAGAIAAYEQALRLDPQSGHAHTNLGMALLMEGDWQRGWQEWRWKAEQVLLPTIPTPHWDGSSDLRGKTLLFHTEGGFGDTLQFIRYANLLANQGVKLGLVCPPPLHRLLQAMPALDWVVAPNAPYPPVDAHALLLSLPKYLGTTLETIPATIPYLSAPTTQPVLSAAPGTRLKVGITWASGAYQGAFLQRFQQRKTCPLAVFADLFSVPDISFYSLQVGQDAQALADLRQAQGLGDRLQDLRPQICDFADTAAWIEQLDLVISVDTSVAHLAGALGKPTWVLLPYLCDWRWGRDRSDTPWYPNLRLFRQSTPEDWPSLIATVKAALCQAAPPPAQPTALPATPPDTKTLFQQGTTALQAGDWDTAIRCYEAILAVNPRSGAAHHNLAVALRLQGRPDHLPQAIAHFQQAIALQTPTAGMHYNLANALREAQDWPAAIAQYQAALQLQPNYPEATLGLGRVYLAQGNSAAAIALYEAFLDQHPDDPEAHAALSQALAAQGETVAAAIAQRQAERLRQRHTGSPVVERHFPGKQRRDHGAV